MVWQSPKETLRIAARTYGFKEVKMKTANITFSYEDYNEITPYFKSRFVIAMYGRFVEVEFTEKQLSDTMYFMPEDHYLKWKLQLAGNNIFGWKG